MAPEPGTGFAAGHPIESPLKKKTPAPEVRVQFDSRFEFIDLVHQVTEDMCRSAGFTKSTALNVSLAVREAVANAIKHGNRQDSAKKVEVAYRLEPRRLVVAVRDQGAGFDLARTRDPLEPENLFRSNGRGIFFIKAFVDNVTFSHRKGGGTEVRMEKHRDAGKTGRARPTNEGGAVR